MVFLVLHILTSVLDSFAPISLTDAVIPFAGSYRPFWLGLGRRLLRPAAGRDRSRACCASGWASRPGGRSTGSPTRAGRSRCCTASAPAATSKSPGCSRSAIALPARRRSRPCSRACSPAGRRTAGARRGARRRGRLLAVPGAVAPAGPLGSEWARRSGTPASLLPHAHPPTTTGAATMSTLSPPPHESRPPAAAPTRRRALPRLLSGDPRARRADARRAPRRPRPAPPARAGGRRRGTATGPRTLIEEVDRAGLLGRGGAAFPTATKMRAVAAARGRAIVVANGAEGEPASLKDHTLLEMLPHLVLDGAILAAEAVGADEVIIARLRARRGERRERRRGDRGTRGAPAGTRARRRACGSRPCPATTWPGRSRRSSTTSTAGPRKPTFTPPMLFEQGVAAPPDARQQRRDARPHRADRPPRRGLVPRARHALPARLGARDAVGSGGPPGRLRDRARRLAGLADRRPAAAPRRACAVRCSAATRAPGSAPSASRGVALSNEHLAPHGATLGAGVVLLLSEEACPVAETARLARWLADQSARQCGPCLHGLDALADAIESRRRGRASGRAAQRIDRLAALDGAPRRLRPPRRRGQRDAQRARGVRRRSSPTTRATGRCEACARPPELPLPHRPVSDETAAQAEARR